LYDHVSDFQSLTKVLYHQKSLEALFLITITSFPCPTFCLSILRF